MARWSLAGHRLAPVPGWAWSGTLHSLVFKLFFFFGLFFFFSFNLKRRGQGQGRGLGREQQQGYLPSSPGPAGWRPHQVGAPARPTTPATPAQSSPPEPPPGVPSLDLILTHMRSHTCAHTHPHNFTKMMEITISLCLFSFLYQAVKKNTPKKENTKKPQTTKQKNCLLCPFRPVSTFPLKYCFVS